MYTEPWGFARRDTKRYTKLNRLLLKCSIHEYVYALIVGAYYLIGNIWTQIGTLFLVSVRGQFCK